MTRNLALFGIAVAVTGLASIGLARAGQSFPTIDSSNSDTALSIGIQYDFGDMQLALVAAARSTKTDTGNDVTGAKLDLSIPLTGGTHAPTIRAMGLAGSTDVQGEIGVGYDFGNSQPLLGAGVQAPYSNGGINYYLNGIFAPYLGINTLKDAPSKNVEFSPVC